MFLHYYMKLYRLTNFKKLFRSSLDFIGLLLGHFDGCTFLFEGVVTNLRVVESNAMLFLNEVIDVSHWNFVAESDESTSNWNDPEESS